MVIQKLPPEVRSKLESGIIVTDAVQCAMELVINSLDAEATGIAVRVDLKNFQIRVIDNGKGIARDDLEVVGERFMTSKYTGSTASISTYGFKGQALSSLLDVCKTLTIETKSEPDGPTFVKIFQNNKALPISEIDKERQGTGTTVTVEDFMCTMPVRRKRINEVFDIEEIKTQLQYLAVIHYNVCFTLRNENKGLILLQTCQASNILESLSNLFGSRLAKSLKPVTFTENNYEVTGFISSRPQYQNSLHLVYINKRIITKGVIHKFIINLLKEYGERKTLFTDSPARQSPVLRLRNSSCSVFILQINCPHSYYELFTNLRKTTVEFKNWKDLLKCVHKAIRRTLKHDKNLDSSSNAAQNESGEEERVRRKFGTSLLLNAVRGAPVKRALRRKRNSKKKNKKENETAQNFDASTLNSDKTNRCLGDSTKKNIEHKELTVCSDDSRESPIPRKRFTSSSYKSPKIPTPEGLNQSTIEFCKWLKGKFQEDPNAFSLYNDFLKSKKDDSSKKTPKCSSPVFVTRGKRIIDKEIAREKQLNSYPDCGDFRIEKPVQFFTGGIAVVQGNFPERTGRPNENNLNFDCEYLYKNRPSQDREKKQGFYQHLPSPAPSEVQFIDIIKFRNFSESFDHQTLRTQREAYPENAIFSSTTSTWTSHYQDDVPRNLEIYGRRRHLENCLPFTYNRSSHKRINLDFAVPSYTCSNVNKCLKERVKMQDVEVQVNMAENHASKVNATAQTSNLDALYRRRFEGDLIVPESPSFESGINFVNRESFQNVSRQEVPAPDFWNTSTPSVFLNSAAITVHQFENIGADVNALPCEKKTLSEAIPCGQKSNSAMQSQNEKSLSKETQTYAALWPESLGEMNNINSGSMNEVESAQLPKTLPLSELEGNFTAPLDSCFSLTERHDFVPKGLSPRVLNIESFNIFTLTPRERNRIKLTIDNAENELLASIKWQDESTGCCTKPTIPDGILCEMREKAERNLITNENQILSASLSYCAIKVHNLLHSFAFTKELLAGVEILGQLDKKFIVAKMEVTSPKKMELISLFDQHAVDERIKLEEIINGHVLPDGKFTSSSLNPPVECTVNESYVRVISNLEEKLKNFGLDIGVINENTITFRTVPTFMLNKHEKDVKNGKNTSLADILQALVLSIADEITETRGAASKIPKIIHNAFCLEACHRAIKFNRILTKETMIDMINNLKNCNLPFQCAHGRPSVIPIIDLEDFKPTTNENIDFQKLKDFVKERINI